MNCYRTHTCGQLNKADVGQSVKIAGWVDTIRDHGGVIFIDLRDHYGVTQVVLNDESLLKGIGKEFVVSVSGVVGLRDAETVNPKISTGEVELKAEAIVVLGEAQRQLPFEISESTKTKEDIRLKYRFLDLRNPAVHNNILLRSKITSYLRRKMEEMGFVEIQTPILTASSPEGARDYLVPSRKHKASSIRFPRLPSSSSSF